MNLWSAIANVKFVAAVGSQITDGENEILFVRGTDQQAHTTDYTNVHLLNTATISIDTSVASSGWNSLYNLGTADTSGLGNYGFLTVIHELGHALGLYHPGNYNESASIGTQQTDYYDTQQYSLMSYFDAGYSGADRYVSNGGTTTQVFDQTPQLNDIQAIQSIYGASTTLTGGDTFGFNSTFGTMSAHPLREYDFTQNPTPVVTLWDGGTHNTLDLSGFSTDSTVDLRQGQFSSVAGMTDNLSIAFGTTIDTAIGGAGDDIFTLNGDADIVNGGGGSNTVVFTAARAGYTLTNTAGVVTATIGGVTSTFTNVQTLRFTDQTVLASNIPAPCFATGTRIATDQGEIPVERLVEGMRVRLAEGGFAPITWIGHRRVQCRNHPRPWDVMPVHVRANAFGPGRPHAELVLSPDHSVYADGVLVPVRYLLNDATIYQRDTDTITWWHVELDRHAALLAEGLPCESYLDTGNRGAFVNGGVVIQAHPDFALKVWEAESFAPLVTCGPGLVALRTQLLARAEAMGFTTTDDPDVHLIANGVRIDPTWYGDTAQFVLPERVDIVRLVSRSTKPAAILPASDDVRPLGLCISGIELDHRRIALNHPRLTTGWHSEEAGLRWTSGEAALDCTEACLLEITVQRLMAYRDAA
jgi:serralysin